MAAPHHSSDRAGERVPGVAESSTTSARHALEEHTPPSIEQQQTALEKTTAAMKGPARAYKFRCSELRSLGIFAVMPLGTVSPTSTLSNAILPLLDQAHWSTASQDVFHMLLPALRLASLWLSNESISSYWLTLIYGKRSRYTYANCSTAADTDQNKGKELYWVQRAHKPTLENAGKVTGFLNNMQDHIRYEFSDRSSDGVYASHWPEKRKNPLPPTQLVQIHTAFYDFAKANIGKSDHDANAILRFNFLLATTLTHEIAHAVHYENARTQNESYHVNQYWAEAGFAWEVSVLGGITGVMSTPVGLPTAIWTLGALLLTDMEDEAKPGDGKPVWSGVRHAIPMTYVWKIQQEDSWSVPGDKTELCRIPRTGPHNFPKDEAAN